MSETKELQMQQITVQRKNLAQVCRFAVKSLIDRSCFDTMGEGSPEIVNFCNIMEHVLSHRLKPRTSWYSQEDPSFWNYIKKACSRVPHNCINSIQFMEHIITPRGKGRAWLKVVLMEKRLSEYISIALKQTKITKAAFYEGALMLSDEAHLLTGTLLGLNAIDFSFDLKGENVDIGGLPVIDYTPFLKFQQCPESIHSDTRELHMLSNSNSNNIPVSEALTALDDDSIRVKYSKMESKYKTICEQKGYLEELVRLREDQLEDVQTQQRKLVETLHNVETENRRERQQLESVIIELQAQLSMAKKDQEKLAKKLKEYMTHSQPTPIIREPSMEAVTFHEVSRSPLRARPHGDADRLSTASNELSTAHGLADSRSILSDSRSLLSELSAAGVLLDETSSMIPMAGSFTSLNSTRSGEATKTNDATKFTIDFVLNDPVTSSVDTKLLSPVAMAVLETNAYDNDNDEGEGMTYYTNHNENKVCVTAQVHRADSLLSPMEEKTDLPENPAPVESVTNNCNMQKNTSEMCNVEEKVECSEGGAAEMGHSRTDESGHCKDSSECLGEKEAMNSQVNVETHQEGNSTSTNSETQRLSYGSESETSLSEGLQSGANIDASHPGHQVITEGNMNKHTAEEDLADQETLCDFNDQVGVLIDNQLTGETFEKHAEEDHSGGIGVEGQNGEENFHDHTDADDYRKYE